MILNKINNILILLLLLFSKSTFAEVFNGKANFEYAVYQGNISLTFPFSLQEKPNLIKINPGLTYSSSSNASVGYGWGWNISGVDEVRQCNGNIFHDGSFEYLSEYCLNGKRLFLSSGVHLENGARYRLEDNLDIEVEYIKDTVGLITRGGYFISTEFFGLFKVHNNRSGETRYYGGQDSIEYNDQHTQYNISIIEDSLNSKVKFEYITEMSEGDRFFVNQYIKSIKYDNTEINFNYEYIDPVIRKTRKLTSVNVLHNDLVFSTYNIDIPKHFLTSFTECHKNSCSERTNFNYDLVNDYPDSLPFNEKEFERHKYDVQSLWSNSSKIRSLNVSQENREIIRFNFKTGLVNYEEKIDLSRTEKLLYDRLNLLDFYEEESPKKHVNFTYKDPFLDKEINRFLSFKIISRESVGINKNSVKEVNEFYTSYPLAGYLKSQRSYNNNYLIKEIAKEYEAVYQGKNIFEVKESSYSVLDYDDFEKKVNNKLITNKYSDDGKILSSIVNYISYVDSSVSYRQETEYSNYGTSDDVKGGTYAEYLLPGTITNRYFTNNKLNYNVTQEFIYDKFLIKEERINKGSIYNSAIKTFTYDDKGQLTREVTKVQIPTYENNGTISSYETRNDEITYNYDGLFLSSVTDSMNNKRTFIKDKYCAKPAIEIDVNSNETYYSYDELCRIKSIKHHDGSTTDVKYILDDSVNILGNQSLYKIVETNSKSPTKTSYYDLHDNEIRVSHQSLHNKIINVDYYSDINVKKISKPYFSGENIYWETTTSNLLGNVKQIETPLGITTFTKLGNVITKIDAEGEIEETIIGPKGNILQKEYNEIVIKFNYDFNGNVVHVNHNGVTSDYQFDYDNNLLEFTDTISGHSIFKYDFFRNVLWSKDSNLNLLKIKYDQLNRVKSKEYYSRDGKYKIDKFTWDEKPYGKLQLSKVETNGYLKDYFYNENSRVTKIIQRTDSSVLEKNISYDQIGRISYETFPNGLSLHKEYDDFGYLISEYIKISGNNLSISLNNEEINKAISEVRKLKNKLYNEQKKDHDLIIQLQDELNRLKESYYIEKKYDYNDLSLKLNEYVFIDSDGRKYRQSLSGDFYRETIGQAYSCNKYDDERCSNIEEQLILEKVSDAHLLMLDGQYEYVDGKTGATDYEPVAEHNEVTRIVRVEGGEIELRYQDTYFYSMKKGLSSHAKTLIGQISTGINDEIYKLKSTAGGYADMIAILEELESEISKENIGRESEQITDLGFQRILGGNDKYYVWSIDKLDQYDRVSSITHGNGTFTSKFYNPANTQLMYIKTLSAVGLIRDMEYGYDNVNNMTYKYDNITTSRDDYHYKSGRLASHKFNVSNNNIRAYQNVSYYYDSLGNISNVIYSGSGLSIDKKTYRNEKYTYNDTKKPYQLTKYDDVSYVYDSIGNIVGYGEVKIERGTYSKPTKIYNNISSLQLKYNPFGELFHQSGEAFNTTYLEDNYQETIRDGLKNSEIYISAYGEKQAVIKKSSLGKIDVDYFYSDPLGSIDTVIDSSGIVKQRLIYSPFGERGVISSETGMVSNIKPVTNLSFTGHEELEEFSLVHMKGRVYDPKLKRFLSPDPIINDKHSAPSYNRYSYVFNNPLKYTDPSGYIASEQNVDDAGGSDNVSMDNFGSDDNNTDMGLGSTEEIGELGKSTSDELSSGSLFDGIIQAAKEIGGLISEALRPSDIEIAATMAALGTPMPFDDLAAGAYWAGKATYATISAVSKYTKISRAAPSAVRQVQVSLSRHPEAAQHILDAQGAGHPSVLTVNRTMADANRRDSLRGVPTKTGLDRDEYPPAMFEEGGFGASVRHIDPGDNRGAGAVIGNQLKGAPDGTVVSIVVVP